MTGSDQFLLSVQDLITIYAALLESINTIWNVYVFVLLGMVGWILARAHEFEKSQKLLITIVLTVFNGVVIFYFFDAYQDINRVKIDLIAHKDASSLVVPPAGISENLISYDPISRFFQVAGFVIGFLAFIIYLVWSRSIWNKGPSQ